MKKTSPTIPLMMTASLASIMALNLSCGKNEKPKRDSGDNPSGTNSLAVAAVETNASRLPVIAAAEISAVLVTNVAVAGLETNALPVIVTNVAVAAPEIPIVSAVTNVVEMPVVPPVAPTNFYNETFPTNKICRLDNDCDHYFAARVGYEHSGYGNGRDSLYAGVKFYSHNDKLRSEHEKLRWFIPDAAFELSHQSLPQPDFDAGGGLQQRSDFFWPWVNWTTKVFARDDSACAFARPTTVSVGPAVSLGFDKTFDGSGFRFTRYGGARLAVNRYAFVQYTWGRTDDFATWRQEFLAEIPFYISHDEHVRYGLRGEWMRGALSEPDYYQIGVFVEMPLGLLARPCEWPDLIPFAK